MIEKHLCNIINMDIDNYNVPDNTKVATARPLYKKKSRNELENYRPQRKIQDLILEGAQNGTWVLGGYSEPSKRALGVAPEANAFRAICSVKLAEDLASACLLNFYDYCSLNDTHMEEIMLY